MVELMVTIVVAGLVVLSVLSLFIAIDSLQAKTRRLEVATRAAEQQVESLRNNNYTLLAAGDTIDFTADLPDGLPSPRSGSVVIEEPEPGIKRVDVTITYRDGSNSRDVKVSSLIGQIGIGGQ
jgi:type II secretory pathway pseudopilin PulG